MKVAMILPNPNDATSMARGAMPLSMLARSQTPFAVDASGALCPGAGMELQIVTRDAWSWSDLVQCEAVFMQRPHSQDHFQLCVMAKQLSLPLWVDYDDALDVLPYSNPLWSEKFQKEMTSVQNAVLQYADVVTVTTNRLRETFTEILTKLGKAPKPGKIRLLPNAHNDYMMGFMDLARIPRQKLVTWRGSATHDEDLQTILPQLAAIANDPKFAAWKFAFLGEAPWQVRKVMPPERTILSGGWKNYFLFMNEWAASGAAIHIVPLADNEFNQCKSNLAWLEASAVGAVTLAPRFAKEFHRPGCWNYGSQGTDEEVGTDFKSNLEMLMDQAGSEENALPALLEKSRSFIKKNLLLSKVNEQRLEILREFDKGLTRRIS